jgi:hypothetical protein
MMMIRRISKSLACLLVISSAQIVGCADSDRVETVRVSLSNAATYQYPTVGGDEEGARIITQAKHYRVSEIRRNEATNWIATYVYQPTDGFVGSEYVEIEILAGSDGASPPTKTKRVGFYIDIRQ